MSNAVRRIMRLVRWLLPVGMVAMPLLAGADQGKDRVNKARELRCLALNIYHEARGEPIDGQLAVAIVTMNRVRSDKYPNTVCRVVWQHRQFSWTQDGRSDRPRDRQAWALAKRIAEVVYEKYDLLKARSKGAWDITRGALYYYAPHKVDPHWARYKQPTRQIGGHLFLREDS